MRKYLGMLFALFLASDASAQGTGVGVGLDDILTRRGGGAILGPSLDFNFSAGEFFQSGVAGCTNAATCLTVTRTTTNGSATNLLPASALGQPITSFGNNVPRPAFSGGLIVEEARTNQLLNATAPVTQTTASVDCSGSCTLWVNGTGSATPSAGTATGCVGFAAATQGAPNTFTCVAGTIIVTVAGSLNAFQLEQGLFGTSLCTSGASACSRGADVITATTGLTFGASITQLLAGTGESPQTNPTNQIGLETDDGTITNRITLGRASSPGIPFSGIVVAGVAQTVPGQAAGWAQNVLGKFALSAAVNNTATSFNAAAVTTAAANTMPTMSRIVIGSRGDSTLFWNGVIARVAVWPTVALTNAQLQIITQ